MSLKVGSLLRKNRTKILQRWQARIAEMTEALHISRIELLDHMPSFLDGVIGLFEEPLPAADAVEAPAQATAPLHGEQRLRVGFDVDEVIREYGILVDVLLETLHAAGATLASDDQRRLMTAVNAGAAEAVRAYVAGRDEELRREQAKHRAFIAHELRTPLATAHAATALLAQLHPEVNAGRPMELLGRSLAQARELVDHVLLAGSLDAGVEPQRADVDVAALATEIMDTLRPEAESRKVTITLDAPSTLHAEVDVRLVYSALANLVRNALKYTREGSLVRVAVRADGDEVACEVADGCGGITARNWTEIFEPFIRGDDAAARQRDGLGLGLAIAKHAVEAHGGSIAVRNVAPEGCVFELHLPRGAPKT